MQDSALTRSEDPDVQPSPARLVSNTGKIFDLDHDESIIGRAREADVVISEPGVSRIHASIERVGTRYQLLDLGSTNGTRWNGVRLSFDPVNLTDGDEISLSDSIQLTFSREAPEPLTLHV